MYKIISTNGEDEVKAWLKSAGQTDLDPTRVKMAPEAVDPYTVVIRDEVPNPEQYCWPNELTKEDAAAFSQHDPRIKVLFVCSGNSCRSAMAMEIAQTQFDKDYLGLFICQSAAGHFDSRYNNFKANKVTSDLAIHTMKNANLAAGRGRGSQLEGRRPRALRPEDLERANFVFFLGDKFSKLAKNIITKLSIQRKQ